MPPAEFFVTSLIVVLVPGTGVIYTVSTGLMRGCKASVAAAVGCTTGILPHLAASIAGLSAMLHLSAQMFQLLKLAGAAYLIYLAWSMWRDTDALPMDSPSRRMNLMAIAVKGVLINILNPKLTIFFFAFLPLFVTPAVDAPWQMIGLSAIFMGMTLVIFVLYGVLASVISGTLTRSPKAVQRLQRSCALIFAGMAVKLALSER